MTVSSFAIQYCRERLETCEWKTRDCPLWKAKILLSICKRLVRETEYSLSVCQAFCDHVAYARNLRIYAALYCMWQSI